MCGLGSTPDAPDVPAPPPVAPEAPDASRQERVTKNGDDERKRRMMMGRNGTILTGPRGIDNNETGNQTILG